MRLLLLLILASAAFASRQFTPFISGRPAGSRKRPQSLTPYWTTFLAYAFLQDVPSYYGCKLAESVLKASCDPDVTLDRVSVPVLDDRIAAGEAALSLLDESGQGKESTWFRVDLYGESNEEKLERMSEARDARIVIVQKISSLKSQRGLAYIRLVCWSVPGKRFVRTLVRSCIEWWRPAVRILGLAWVKQGSLREVPWETKLLKCLLVVAGDVVRYAGEDAAKKSDAPPFWPVVLLDLVEVADFLTAVTDDSLRDSFDRLLECRLIVRPRGRG